jgi:hypothetical protein
MKPVFDMDCHCLWLGTIEEGLDLAHWQWSISPDMAGQLDPKGLHT